MTIMTVVFTHWGRVTHICVSKLTIIGSDNGLSLGRRQAIIWTNAEILLIRTLGTNFSEILSEIHAFSLKKMHFKMSYAKWRPFCLGLNVSKGFPGHTLTTHYLRITNTCHNRLISLAFLGTINIFFRWLIYEDAFVCRQRFRSQHTSETTDLVKQTWRSRRSYCADGMMWLLYRLSYWGHLYLKLSIVRNSTSVGKYIRHGLDNSISIRFTGNGVVVLSI